MNLTDEEREMLRAMRAVTINQEGHEVFVGLDAHESVEFLDLDRRNESGENMQLSSRYILLKERHEAARQQIVEGLVPLDRTDLLTDR